MEHPDHPIDRFLKEQRKGHAQIWELKNRRIKKIREIQDKIKEDPIISASPGGESLMDLMNELERIQINEKEQTEEIMDKLTEVIERRE